MTPRRIRRCLRAGLLALVGLAVAGTAPALAQAKADADWPCIQRKVATISPGAVWAGPDLAAAGPWGDDFEAAALAQTLASRRTPIEEADALIDAFAGKAGSDKTTRLTRVFAGVLELVNTERDRVIAGLGRYARGQSKLAERVRDESDKLGEVKDSPMTETPKEARGRRDRAEMGRAHLRRAAPLADLCLRGADAAREACLRDRAQDPAATVTGGGQFAAERAGRACSGATLIASASHGAGDPKGVAAIGCHLAPAGRRNLDLDPLGRCGESLVVGDGQHHRDRADILGRQEIADEALCADDVVEALHRTIGRHRCQMLGMGRSLRGKGGTGRGNEGDERPDGCAGHRDVLRVGGRPAANGS